MKRAEEMRPAGAAVLALVQGDGAPSTEDTPMAWRCPRCGDMVRMDGAGAVQLRTLNASLRRAGKPELGPIPCEPCNAELDLEDKRRREREEAAKRVAAARVHPGRPPPRGEEI